MIAPLREFQTLVLSRPSGDHGHRLDDNLFRRVEGALRALVDNPTTVGTGDIAGLIRQSMLRAQLLLGDTSELRVPKAVGWPDEQAWALFKCDAREVGVGHYVVRPRPWAPSWLDKGASSVIEDAIKQAKRRQHRPVPSDPAVREYANLQEYVSPGQRAAVQAAFVMPAGSTAIINLPTGGGKTLAFQLPALTWANQGGLTVVVTPTVSLAKDQEERFLAFLKIRPETNARAWPPLAYHSGLDDEAKQKIRNAIRNGEQPIIFASPEAVMGALRGSLFEAAREGRLRLFAIDEAHVVSQWGQQFRPEFQSIAGLKDALLEVCPPEAKFRTLLLTATLTSECCETLRFLFGQGGCQIISESALRPEPGFLLHSADDEVARDRRIMEALRYLPRPLILYTTLREAAEHFYWELQRAEFRRVRMVRGGDLTDLSGDLLLREWKAGSFDIVVATSAFGLGMDQTEVRSIVHACLPETIDRYYQEVGRSGRDGLASAALLVSTPQDLGIAEELTRERLISVERGFERWEAMWTRRRRGENDVYIVSLDDRPADIVDTGLRNVSWNLRTLVLMARTGLITFSPHVPPQVEREASEDIGAFEERRRRELEKFSREIGLRVNDWRHSNKVHWDDVVARTRMALRMEDEQAVAQIRELRRLRRPLNEIFRQVYTLTDPPVSPPQVMGSCPVTRNRKAVSFLSSDPELVSITATGTCLSKELQRALATCSDDVGRSWIACRAVPADPRELRRWREGIRNVLRYAVTGGIVEFCVSDDVLSDKDWSDFIRRSSHRFVIRDYALGDRSAMALPVPRLTFLDERNLTPTTVAQTLMVDRPRHIIIVPPSTPDPHLPYRRLLDLVRHLSVEDLLARLQS
jgi:ATP-dependent DNA helicase RecQ